MGRSVGIAVALAVLAATASARPGKVIRVERRTHIAARAIAICNAMFGATDRLTCLSGDVSESESLHLLSKHGDYERLEVIGRLQSPLDSCNLGTPFDVKIRSASSQSRLGNHETFALGGIEASAGRSRLIETDKISPPEPGLEVGLAIDLSGDGRPELLATSRQCPETRRLEGRLAGKALHQSICVAVWEREPRAHKWRKNNEVVLHFCR